MTAYDFGPGPALRERFCFPEELSPLFYAPSFASLGAEQRLVYNRLQACYFNEQLMFFEDALAQSVVRGALAAGVPRALAASLRQFSEEERAHSDMFRRLNRLLAPELYGDRDYVFIDAGAATRRLLDAAASLPRVFPLFIWVMLLQEERSLHYSREILRGGDLEPHFVAAYRLHMADEAGHVRFDAELIDLFWRGRCAPLRRLNAALLRWSMRQFFNAPRRACLRVLDELGRRRPELAPRVPTLRAELRSLESDPAYHRTLYSRRITPAAFALLDGCPELAGLSKVMLAYSPGEALAHG